MIFTVCGCTLTRLQHMRKQDSLFLFIVMMEADCFQDRSVFVRLIKRDGAIRLVYRVAGKGTAEFSGMHTGAQLRIVGPLGNGFPKKEKKPF